MRIHVKLRECIVAKEAEKLRKDLKRDVAELREVLEKNIFFGLSKPRRVRAHGQSHSTRQQITTLLIWHLWFALSWINVNVAG